MQNWYEETRKKTDHIFHAIIKYDFVTDMIQDFILSMQGNRGYNPYQSLIDTYARTASPENLAKMEEVFIKTSQLEWMFWDSAYKQESWKI